MKRLVCWFRGHKTDGPWSSQRASDPTVYVCCTRCWREVAMRDAQWPSR